MYTYTSRPAGQGINSHLELFFEESKDGAGDDAADAAAVDAQHGDDVPVGRRRRPGRQKRGGRDAAEHRVQGQGPAAAVVLRDVHRRHGLFLRLACALKLQLTP